MEKSEILLNVIQNLSDKMREIKEKEFSNTDYIDLSVTSIYYLYMISTLHNPTFVELTAKLGLSKPSVTVMVNKLITKGYASKVRSAEDGRSYNIVLTDKGRQIAEAYNKAYNKVVRHIENKLDSNEIATLIALLAKIS